MAGYKEVCDTYEDVEGLDEITRADAFGWVLRRACEVSTVRDAMELEQQTGGESYDLSLARSHFDELRALALFAKLLHESGHGL